MNPIAYIPIASTIISVYFLIEILAHLKQKPNAIYLRWWTVGIFCYGLGTTIESTHTFLGWSPFIFKSWYIAGAFLGGGAIYSAYKYSQMTEFKSRFWGNLCIAIGGLLPGIGGTATKFGETYVLYVTELIGIIFIYLGYKIIKSDRSISLYESQIQSKALGNS